MTAESFPQLKSPYLGSLKKLALIVLIFGAVACHHPKSMSEDELRSSIKAAEEGDTDAMMNLYLFYADEGDGKSADHWISLAVKMGDPNAEYHLGSLLLERNESIASANKGKSLLVSAAQKGVTAAQEELGRRYRAGDGLELSLKDAEYWFRAASKGGSPFAMFNLADLIIGKEASEDALKEALNWNKSALASPAIKKGSYMERLLLKQQSSILGKIANAHLQTKELPP